MTDRQLLTQALEHFKLASAAEAQQRARELEDLRFVDLREQWPDEVKRLRAGTADGKFSQRPCLVVDKLSGPIQQVINQQRTASLSIVVHPKSEGAAQGDAELRQDLIRQIEVDSHAVAARSWAYERAVKVGRGWYRVLTRYVDDESFDQELVIERILNQASVYDDPAAHAPDGTDARFRFVTDDMPRAVFERQYGARLTPTADELSGLGDALVTWATDETVRVAEYWYVDETPRERVLLSDGQTAWRDALPTDLDPALIVATRRASQRNVKMCKMTATAILEQHEWEGIYIPIIPVFGREHNVNGVRVFDGMVAPAKDSQRGYNYQVSAMTEATGLAPLAPWVAEEGQLEGHEQEWQYANVRRVAVLQYKRVGLSGQPAPAPTRQTAEPPIQAISHSILQFDADIKSTTAVYDPSLGNLSAGQRSGKAILALQRQSELGSSDYLANLVTAMTYEARVLLDLIPRIYDRPGRVVQVLGIDDAARAVMLNQPFQKVDGQLQPVATDAYLRGRHELHDLSRGAFTASVSVGKSFTTRREEGAAMIGQLLEAAPQLGPVVADLWVKSMDFPEARQIADRLKKLLPPQLKEGDDGGQGDPQAAMAQLQQQAQQLAQQHEALVKELQAKTAEIEQDKASAEKDVLIVRLNNETKERIAALQAQASLIATEAKVHGEAQVTALQGKIDAILHKLDHTATMETLAATPPTTTTAANGELK